MATTSVGHLYSSGYDYLWLSLSIYLIFKFIEVIVCRVVQTILRPFAFLWSKKTTVPPANTTPVEHAEELLKQALTSGINPDTGYLCYFPALPDDQLKARLLSGKEIIYYMTELGYRCPRDIRIICENNQQFNELTIALKEVDSNQLN